MYRWEDSYIPLNDYDIFGGDKTCVFEQAIPVLEWNITHPLNKYPSVSIVDSANTIVYGEVTYLSLNNIKINFSSAVSGRAFLN